VQYNLNSFDIKNKKKKQKRVTFFIILSVLVVVLVLISFFIVKNVVGFIYENNEIKVKSKKLFDQKNYVELIEKMDNELKKMPFSPDFLIYRGFSYFLLGEEENNIEKRKTYFLNSIIDLRKSLAIGASEFYKPNIYFCIGKIYYYFGESYYNLSIRYLSKSLESGNKRKDLYYILGLVYNNTGKYDEAIKCYNESLKIEENDLVLYAVAVSFFKNNDYENSKRYLEKVINISKEPKIIENSYLLYGEILFSQKDSKAMDYFNKVIEINDNNADAYFYRGEIYFQQNDKIKARYEWRKALEIDPSHIRARNRYY
jgi:tetratricopeptide (TPR) repeat protein